MAIANNDITNLRKIYFINPGDVVYTDDDTKYEIYGYKYFNSGGCANVFKRDNIALKIYDLDCCFRDIMKKKIFKYLRELDIPNIVKLYNYYYLTMGQRFNRMLPMDCYTMEYIDDNEKRLVDSNKEYLTDILIEHKILIFDAHENNILFTENGVTILDPDMFYVRRFMSEDKIKEHNTSMMFKYITKKINFEMKGDITTRPIFSHSFEQDKGLKEGILSAITEDTIRKTLTLKK